jgi:hypothetical protein
MSPLGVPIRSSLQDGANNTIDLTSKENSGADYNCLLGTDYLLSIGDWLQWKVSEKLASDMIRIGSEMDRDDHNITTG